MDSDLEFAMLLQREEEALSSDYLLAGFLYDELNNDFVQNNNSEHFASFSDGHNFYGLQDPGLNNHVNSCIHHPRLPIVNQDSTEDEINGHYPGYSQHHFNRSQMVSSTRECNNHNRNHNFHDNLRSRSVNYTSNNPLSNHVNTVDIQEGPIRSRSHITRNMRSYETYETNDYENLLNLGDMIGDAKSKGLNQQQLFQLPITTYVQKESNTLTKISKSSYLGNSDDDNECRICISHFEANDRLRILPCMHKFHVDCIDQWIQKNSICPVCRIEIKEQLA